jgi:hypothetical protein
MEEKEADFSPGIGYSSGQMVVAFSVNCISAFLVLMQNLKWYRCTPTLKYSVFTGTVFRFLTYSY